MSQINRLFGVINQVINAEVVIELNAVHREGTPVEWEVRTLDKGNELFFLILSLLMIGGNRDEYLTEHAFLKELL